MLTCYYTPSLLYCLRKPQRSITMPKRLSFKLDTTTLVKQWATALQNDQSWNDFVVSVSKDAKIIEDNQELYESLLEVDVVDIEDFPRSFRKCIAWSTKEHKGKSYKHIFNQAWLCFVSNKCLQKINNLRSRPQFKKNGKSIDRPTGWGSRFGVNRSVGRRAINWPDLVGLFGDEDFNDS